jgi:hypothetical protein
MPQFGLWKLVSLEFNYDYLILISLELGKNGKTNSGGWQRNCVIGLGFAVIDLTPGQFFTRTSRLVIK